MSQHDHEIVLQLHNSAGQFFVASLVAVVIVQFSLLLLVEGKVNTAELASSILLSLSFLIAYVVVVLLGAYLIHSYMLHAALLEYVANLPVLSEIHRIDLDSRRAIGEIRRLREARRSIVTRSSYRIIFPFCYVLISSCLFISVLYLPI